MTNHDRSPGASSDAQPDQAQHVHAPESGSELAALIRSFDWSTTSLGPLEAWPQSLKTSVDIMVQSPVPMVTLWGPDGVMIYNDGYGLIAANKHPSILGSKVLEAWPEAADFNRHALDVVLGGKALTYRDQYLVLNRERGPEDVWLDINYSPVLDETGRPAGVMVIVVETTARVLEERKRRETEERYQLALEATGMIGVCELNVATNMVYADARFADMYGVSTERSAQGAALSEYLHGVHPDDVDAVGEAVAHTIATRTSYNQEYRLLPRNGRPRWVHVRGHVFKDGAGEWTRILAVVVDISEQKQTEQALRDSEKELQLITDQVPELVSYVDHSLRYRFVNKAYEQWLGVPREAILGKHIGELLGEEDFLLRKPMLERALAGEELTFEAPMIIQGQTRDTEIRLFPRRDHGGTVVGVYGFVLDISERKRAAETLRVLNQGLEQQVQVQTREREHIWNLSQDPFVIADSVGRWLSASPAWSEILGWSEADLVGRTSEWMEHPDDRAKTREEGAHLASGLKTLRFENRFQHRDGSYRWFSWTAVPDNGLLYCVARDVTEEKQRQAELEHTQELLRQAQKMEAIGQLTGGIAHDFNNMLAGISGSLELLQRRVAAGRYDGLDHYIETAIASSTRAASLTHRLLAFSRRQTLHMEPVDINSLIISLEDLLRRTIGENIALAMELEPELWPTLTDANQIENALLNLCINARDAMPDGGKLTIATVDTTLDESYTRTYEDVEPGDYVVLSVSDTGSGMSPEIIARAFDPFFTTKPLGQGTGLGLSMIYGFVKQTGGHVRIASEIDQGTTVKLYLPRHVAELEPVTLTDTVEWPRALADECVLVVEDDIAVRMVITEVLDESGYSVIECADPHAAITELESGQHIDLLITDVGLPAMNGRQLAEIARQLRPELPVLFVTGYAEGAAVRGAFLDAGMDLISKPFDIDALAKKVRAMLGR